MKLSLIHIYIESRATSSWEHGNPVHQGTQKILRQYAVSFDSSKSSQQISRSDFEFFDLILGMDESNVEDLLQVSAGRYDDKIKLFRPGGVPDPWYTGDFEETYNLVTAGCQDWLQWIKAVSYTHLDVYKRQHASDSASFFVLKPLL